MTTRRVVVVGAGSIAHQWLRPLAARPNVELVALVDPSTERARVLADELGLGVPVHAGLEEVLETERPDTLVNLTPPALHRLVSERGLDAGCDVLTEKPMASTLEDGIALVERARATGRTLAVMQNRRYLAPVVRMRELVASGAIGDVVHVCIDMFLWHMHGRDWLRTAQNPLLRDMAIHPFDAVRAVTGTEPVSVQAREWTSPSAWMDGPDAAACTWLMSGGVVFSYRGSWVSEGLETSYDGVWRIGGTKGTLVWDGLQTLSLEQVERDGPFGAPIRRPSTVTLDAATDIGHAAGLTTMLDALDRGDVPETCAADNLTSLAMVFAAIAAAADGSEIRVEELLAASR